LSDWSIIPDKLDHSPISLVNIMAEGASAKQQFAGVQGVSY
jgi:hypothetical protein